MRLVSGDDLVSSAALAAPYHMLYELIHITCDGSIRRRHADIRLHAAYAIYRYSTVLVLYGRRLRVLVLYCIVPVPHESRVLE